MWESHVTIILSTLFWSAFEELKNSSWDIEFKLMDTNNSSSPSQAADGKYCVEECCCNNYLIGHWGFSPGTPIPCKIFRRWLLLLSNSYTDRTSQYFWLITMISCPLISYQWHRHVSILPPKALSVITHSFQARLLKTRCTIQRWV